MTVTTTRKAEIIKDVGGSDKNTGSSAVQVALLTERINDLTGHLQKHVKDVHSRKGLLKMVSSRAKLLKYIHRTDIATYRSLTEKLGIRQKG